MEDTAYRAVAIVGAGAILPDAPNVAAFWQNVKTGRYSIRRLRRTVGIRRAITMPTPPRRIKPIRKSAVGCASMNGIR